MPIHHIFDAKESETLCLKSSEASQSNTEVSSKDRLISSLTARILFFILLLGDIVWGLYATLMIVTMGILTLVTLGKVGIITRLLKKNWIALKRSSICGISLLIALFNPSLGIMIACTYFLMYDKRGIQEVVPQSLQDQFQEFLK